MRTLITDRTVKNYTEEQLSAFVGQYLETALWADVEEDYGDDIVRFGRESFSQSALDLAQHDCLLFLASAPDIEDCRLTDAAHDFWLTRQGHGAGFWDGDWDDGLSDQLTDLCGNMGPTCLYLGQDDLFHFAEYPST